MKLSALLPRLSACLLLLSLAACGSVSPPAGRALSAPSPEVLADLAPQGRLRAAINFGNPILAQRDPATGQARGVSVDLAQELGRRLGVPVELLLFDSAGRVFDAARNKGWDLAFLAIDPARASDIQFSPPYVVIEGAYLVRQNSPLQTNDEVDRPGVRIAVGRGSAYDLYLSREIRRASLIHAPTSPAVVDLMMTQGLEVAAGVKQQLEADSLRHPGTRLLPGRFMAINQAMGTAKGRPAGAAYVANFIEAMKAQGLVAEALRRHGIEGASIAPAEGRR